MSKMAMRQAKVRYTYNDYLLLPEDKRFEILDGELLVVPAPGIRHQRLSQRLAVALLRHVEAGDPGEVLYAPCDVILSDENVVQPDLLFVREERLGIIGEANIKDAPDLSESQYDALLERHSWQRPDRACSWQRIIQIPIAMRCLNTIFGSDLT